jgi:hypothetical protein
MHLNFVDRQAHTCPSGSQWYVCKANSFTGCCTRDACDFSTCPDNIKPSSSASLVPSTLSTSRSSTTTSKPSSTSQSAITTATPTYAPKTIPDAGVVVPSTTSASPSETATVIVNNPSAAPKGPIIGGVIAGIIVLAIFTAMLWWFCRRRKQLNMAGGSSPFMKHGRNGSEKSAMSYSPDSELRERGGGGIFAPFGGKYSVFGVLDVTNIFRIPQDPICRGQRSQLSLVRQLVQSSGVFYHYQCRYTHSRPRKERSGPATCR